MVEPVTIGDATLYLGDCRNIIGAWPPNYISGVVTDPPYGIEPIVGGYGRNGATIENDCNLDACFDALNIVKGWRGLWAAVFYSCRISPDFHRRAAGLNYAGEIIWDKRLPGMGAGIRYQHENIALFKFGAPSKLNDGFSVLSGARVAELHPHEKPVAIIKRLCEMVGGQTILDPFMGSGTTGVACARLGRKFIGVEIEERYFDIACKRIEDAYKQGDLFIEQPKDRPEQLALAGYEDKG